MEKSAKYSCIELLDVEEMAELLRLSPNQIVRLARAGDIPAINIVGKLRFNATEIEHWLDQNKIKPKEERQ